MGYSQHSPQVVAARVQRLVDDVRASAAVVKDLIFKSALDYAVLYRDATTMQPLDDSTNANTAMQQRSVRCNGRMPSHLHRCLFALPLAYTLRRPVVTQRR